MRFSIYYRVRCAECGHTKRTLFRHRAYFYGAKHQYENDHDDVIVTGLP